MEIVELNVPNEETLITCKKDKVFGKKIITDLKTFKRQAIEYKKDEQKLNEMLILNSDTSSLFLEKLITYNLKTNFNSYIEGNNGILPPIFSRKYKNVIEFMNDEKAVYFTDLSIKMYKDIVNKMKDKTKLELLNNGLNKLKENNIKYLNLSLVPLNNESGIYGGVFDREYKIKDEYLEEYRYYHYLKNENVDNDVIDNMCELINEFVKLNGKFYEKFGDEEEIDLFNESGDSVLHIRGLKYSDELKKYTNSLIK